MSAPRIAALFSTSGHSGVDRLARHLLPALVRRGYAVDLLKVRAHGPHLEQIADAPRIIDLGTAHTLLSLPAVVRYLRRERPAVLLADKDRVNRLALAARALAGTPTRLILRSGITISVDLAARGALERWVQRQSMGKLYRFADGVLVPSVGAAEDLASYTGLARAHIHALPPPVVPAALFDTPQPRPDHPWFAPAAPPLILSVGELSARKDFATLIRAFAQLRAQQPARLMILGDGRQREALLTLAAELGVAEDVALPGFVPQPYAYMAHAALFAFASRWEGLGFVLIEALAVGTPVVSTDCPSGPREILDHGRFGPLVPVGDAAALAAAMRATLANPVPRPLLQQAARRFEIETATDAYLAIMGLPPTPNGR